MSLAALLVEESLGMLPGMRWGMFWVVHVLGFFLVLLLGMALGTPLVLHMSAFGFVASIRFFPLPLYFSSQAQR